MKKIGIFGGTFNPIHIAHLIIAERFVEQLNLDKCIFVPNYTSPFKIEENITNHPNPAERFEMVKSAIAGNSKFAVESFEFDKGGISYTVDTAQYFKEKYPKSKLFLLIGTDQAKYFKKWKNWKKIIEICKLCIAVRPDSRFDRVYDKIDPDYIEGMEAIYIDCPKLDISSSEIRYRIKNNLSINYLVPPTIQSDLLNGKFYK